MSNDVLLISRITRPLSARARRAAAQGRDAGASALEWAVIAAIVVVAATLIGGAVYNIVQTKSTQLEACAASAITTCTG
jgi:Flp pilus assembly pilin Flp